MAQEQSSQPRHTPRALSIAGSDSGGGAGIQADLKAFARCGVHGMTAITAITAQSTTGVEAVLPVPAEMILAQVRAVLGDIGVDAVKVGMLGSREATLAVAAALDELPTGTPVVVDPVMVAESGAPLLDEDARAALIHEILPRASVITPNLPEAVALIAFAERTEPAAVAERMRDVGMGDDEELLRRVLALGPRAVLITGGHRSMAVDLLLDSEHPEQIVQIAGPRYPDGAAHGSGCTHSSILAAQLALGRELRQAAETARAITGEAVRNGLRDLGTGAGPVDVLDLRSNR
jgi:hydroxymethylpyrimidine/phosphomethylpyrimidine kinase